MVVVTCKIFFDLRTDMAHVTSSIAKMAVAIATIVAMVTHDIVMATSSAVSAGVMMVGDGWWRYQAASMVALRLLTVRADVVVLTHNQNNVVTLQFDQSRIDLDIMLQVLICLTVTNFDNSNHNM